MDFLIEKGAKINFQDNEAWTPLHHAIRNGRLNFFLDYSFHFVNETYKIEQNFQEKFVSLIC